MPTDPSPLPEGVTLDPVDLVLSTRTYVAEMKETMGLLAGRCEICGWPLYESMDKGCTAGSCSYRPSQPSEVARLRERRRSLDLLNRLTKLADATVRLAEEVEQLKAEGYADLLDQMDEAWGTVAEGPESIGRVELQAFLESRMVHKPTTRLRAERDAALGVVEAVRARYDCGCPGHPQKHYYWCEDVTNALAAYDARTVKP